MVRLVQLITAIVILIGVLYQFYPSAGSSALDYGKTVVGLNRVTVSELLTRAKDFDGKTVTVRGTVVNNAGILGYGVFRIRQGNDDIEIISTHGIPNPGAEVTITGVFKQAVAINRYNYPVIVETK